MPTIRLNLTKLPPTARRQSILVLRKPELIAKFIRGNHWTETCQGVGPTNSLVRIYEQARSGGEATIVGYGVVLLPNGKTMHRLLIVHCWASELQQTRVVLEKITASYLQQLAGLEIAHDFYFKELADDFDDDQATPRSTTVAVKNEKIEKP